MEALKNIIVVTLIGDENGLIRVCTNQTDTEAVACFLIDTVEMILRSEEDGSKETVSPTSQDPSGRTATVGTGQSITNEGHGDSDSGC